MPDPPRLAPTAVPSPFDAFAEGTDLPARRVTVLGATGSIGRSTLDLLARRPDLYTVEALVAQRDVAGVVAAARRLGAAYVAVADSAAAPALAEALAGTGIAGGAGPAAVMEAAERPANWVMGAIAGAAGLAPTLAAVARGATVALANKECLVCAGSLFMATAAAAGAVILPVDSEHNAVFQALAAGRRADVARVVLTASGGPFRTWPAERIRAVRPEDALKHPTWVMGPKVTIDSASLMNKGLELVEAHHLFAVPAERLGVLVHPQSIVHGLVEFTDGASIAGLGAADMRIPIAHALAFPARLAWTPPALDLAALGTLTFEAPDLERFPCLRLALEALAAGGARPTILNAANEIAVAAFLEGRLGFPGIAALVEDTLAAAERRNAANAAPATVDDALLVNAMARSWARELLPATPVAAS